MLKTTVAGFVLDGLTAQAVQVKLLSKLPGSLLNAAFAAVAAPLLFSALRPALKGAGLFDKM